VTGDASDRYRIPDLARLIHRRTPMRLPSFPLACAGTMTWRPGSNAVRRRVEETPKPGDPLFTQVENRVIATAHPHR
jgi:hypothetical protein